MLYFIILTSCSKEDLNQELFFLGDSHIERWDLQKYFPTYITVNKGVSGSGINRLNSMNGLFKGKIIIIIVGINDLSYITNENEYISYYVNTIKALDADRIFLFSIFPTRTYDNDKILRLNNKIKLAINPYTSIQYIDVFHELIKNNKLNIQYTHDGLHLNSWGYDIISNKLKEIL